MLSIKYGDSYLPDGGRLEIDPTGGSVEIEVLGYPESAQFAEIVHEDSRYNRNHIDNVTLYTGTNLSYIKVELLYSENKIPEGEDSDIEARNDNVYLKFKFESFTYDDETDPDHLHPITVYRGYDSLTINYTQGVEPPSTDPVKPYDPENPGESSDPDEITAAQEELTDGGVLGDNKAELKKQLIIKECDLNNEAGKVRQSYMDTVDRITKLENKLKKFYEELDEENSKKKPNSTKISNLTDKINDYNEKLYELMDSMGNTSHLPSDEYNYLQWISTKMDADPYNPIKLGTNELYIDNKYEELKNSNKGMEIDDQMNKLESNLTYLQKFAPQMVSNIATAAMEPNTAIVTTPTGPGAVAGNPMQSTGTLKRIMGQVLALSPVLIELLGQCKSLNLPKSISKPIADLSKVISMLQKLLK